MAGSARRSKGAPNALRNLRPLAPPGSSPDRPPTTTFPRRAGSVTAPDLRSDGSTPSGDLWRRARRSHLPELGHALWHDAWFPHFARCCPPSRFRKRGGCALKPGSARRRRRSPHGGVYAVVGTRAPYVLSVASLPRDLDSDGYRALREVERARRRAGGISVRRSGGAFVHRVQRLRSGELVQPSARRTIRRLHRGGPRGGCSSRRARDSPVSKVLVRWRRRSGHTPSRACGLDAASQ
ncbi:hypothetical protein HEP81_08115 (plasmid) [Streptomyces griseofuscus]|uniref:Uncharacterized protein n=1 Tax=Streptomyces griseofuscus TaxID=146922 RepID=A0A7H1QDG3_9ACTN|nr:hypothetical protein HEP81_08115 [Streptomyces griseofuscus]